MIGHMVEIGRNVLAFVGLLLVVQLAKETAWLVKMYGWRGIFR